MSTLTPVFPCLQVALDTDALAEEIVPNAVQAIVIQILNAVYRGMAKEMTDNENHQTATQYEDSLVGKLYLFTFVNSYAALYFMAFIQGSTSLGCEVQRGGGSFWPGTWYQNCFLPTKRKAAGAQITQS